MSERTHSQSANKQSGSRSTPRRKLVPMVAGTACVGLMAIVVLQFLRAETATSQTAATPDGSAVGRASVNNQSQPLGRVNNQTITYDHVARECVARYGADVLDSIINRMIIQQECERRGVTVTEAEVQQEVQKIVKGFNLALDTWYHMLQTERNITPQQYHRDIIWPMLALKKLAGKDIHVTNEDMHKAFERDYGPRVEARAIFVDNFRRASQIWDECRKSPDEFDELAKKHSEDPNSKPLGGVIPPIPRHAGLDKKIEEEAFKLKAGEISSVIQIGENRYVILKCEGFTRPIVTDIKDVWTELHETLMEEKTQQAVAEVFDGIRKNAQVINYLTNESTVGPRPGQLSPGPIRQTSGTRASSQVTPATPR